MRGFNLDFNLLGDEQVRGELLGISDRLEDASDWFEMFAGYLESTIGRNFDRRGAVTGERWKPLSWAYLGRKIAAGYGSKGILERDGDLRRSLTRPGGAAIRHATSTALVFGTTIRYAGVHQRGNWMMGIPARPMLGMPRDPRTKRRTIASLGLFLRTGELRHPSQTRTIMGS